MKIPAELTERDQWVLWHTVTRGGKPTKMPRMLNGSPASSTDPKTWAPFNAVERDGGKDHGMGFVFTKEDPLCGVDLDGCRDPETGKCAEWARQIILDFNTLHCVDYSKRTYLNIFPQFEVSMM